MRKTFANAQRLDRSCGFSGQKRWCGRPRLHWLVLLLLFGPTSNLVCGQDVKARSTSSSSEDRQRRTLREQWFLRGRSSPGQTGAALRYRAHLRKHHADLAIREASHDQASLREAMQWMNANYAKKGRSSTTPTASARLVKPFVIAI